MIRVDLSGVRAAWWAAKAARAARRQVTDGPLTAVALPPVPSLPASAGPGVRLALRVAGRGCLERSLVRQAWHAAHGSPRDLIIGVHGPDGSFRSHAWLEGDPPSESAGLVELSRRPAR